MHKPFTGPSVWTGADLEADQSWRWPWASEELAEIDAALAHAKAAGVDWLRVSQATFPLQDVARKLEAAAEELENGRGFVLLHTCLATHFCVSFRKDPRQCDCESKAASGSKRPERSVSMIDCGIPGKATGCIADWRSRN